MEHHPPEHHSHREDRRGLLDAPPRTTFVLGLLTGIAVMAIVGMAVLIPLASRARSGTTATTTGTTPTTNTTPSGPVAIKAVTSDDHVRGPSDAPVTVVEYADFQCPYCGTFHPTMQRLMTDYPNKIRWVYRNFPLTSIHPEAQPAAEAAECAAQQGKFWEFADQLFSNQQSLTTAYYPEVAKNIGLNVGKFTSCVKDGSGRAKISADVTDATQIGVSGTPTSYINGTEIPGAQPYETVKAQVDAILANS